MKPKDLLCLNVLLIFLLVGCEKKLTKSDESAKVVKSLHQAVADGDVERVKLLISKGADVNAKDEEEQTPLHHATRAANTEVVQLLVEAGADVNAKDNRGRTPLRLAGRYEPDTVRLLIEAGADVNVKYNRGMTPLHRVLNYENRYIDGQRDLAKLLVAKGADVNSTDKYGRTPLHLAATLSHKDIAELLLAKGSVIDEKDDESGFTALHYTARFGNKSVAELLLAKGADINATNKEGRTPLYIAVHHDYEVAKLLIGKGANANIRAESDQTLFQLAQERKQIESTAPDMIFEGEPNSLFGSRAACGDVDGDGYDDIVIGGWKHNNERGRVYLFYGGPAMATPCDLILDGEKEEGYFGDTITCGDIDNDGYEDIVIGAPNYNSGQGRGYLYWGGKRGRIDDKPGMIFEGETEKKTWFGSGVGCPAIYDIDNDGYRDVIFCAICYPDDRTGRAYLYYGNKKELMDTSCDLVFVGENPGDTFGIAIGCGDVDNDGYGDIVIGARGCQGRGTHEGVGRAYLYYGGSKSNMDAKTDKVFDAESPKRNYFGQGIVCHDFNNDGYDDMVIGSQGYNGRQGRVYLFYGDTRQNLNTAPDMTFDGEIKCSDYGFIILCCDIDGDDNREIVVGADYLRHQVGRVYVYWGSELSSPSPKPGRILTGENPAEWFSQQMACGDVNNDGYDDLVVGAKGYKAGAEQGRAYLYYGGPKR